MRSTPAAVSTSDPARVHREAVVFDATCPLLAKWDYLTHYRDGGVTVASASVASNHDPRTAMLRLGWWHRKIQESGGIIRQVLSVDDFTRVKEAGQFGIMFHFQNTVPVDTDIDLLYAYHCAGLRMMQLTYNRKNYVGDGCDERTDSGLSHFGVRLIEEMNALGIVVDLSHTGVRTTLEAIEICDGPPVFSHSNAWAVCDSPRNLTDEQIRLVAQKGGVIGLNGFPPFVKAAPRPTLDDFIDHLDYIVDLVGADHVGLGIDYFTMMAKVASLEEADPYYRAHLGAGRWRKEVYPPPPYHYPAGIDLPSGLPNFTRRVLERGYNEADVKKFLGGNFIRVFGQVWKS